MSNSTSPTDPWGAEIEGAEWAVIAVGVFVYAVTAAAAAYVVYHRNYPPLKVKQLFLTVIALLASSIWVPGTLAAIRLLPQANHPAFLICVLWSIWLQLVFGVYVWICVLIFRFWRLYAIVRLQIDASTLRFKLSFFLFWGPGILWGIVATAMKVNEPQTIEGVYRCDFEDWAKYITLGFLGVYTIILIFFAISLRSIKQVYLNEYKETRNTMIIFAVLYIIYSILQAINAPYHLWGRVISGFITLATPILAFWTTIGVPMYHCIFNHDAHAQAFRDLVLDVARSTPMQNARTHSKPHSATAPDSTHSQSEKEEQKQYALSPSGSVIEMV